MPTNTPLRYRQIHLDFHTSEQIPGIGAAFDPDAFIGTLRAASVDSITVFAKCHHGWSYYPTAVGAPHPQLARPDLLGDMVTALKAADIDCPIYISVQWDERNARLHPEWRVRAAAPSWLDPAPTEARWHTLCLSHDAYRAELLDHAREVVRRYDPPGLFFDIILTTDCICQTCIARMQAHGLDPRDPAHRLTNDEAVNDRFRREMSDALHAEFPGLRIFYNCGHIHKQGPKRFEPYSHLELESLPTGGWGYDHFPSSARYAATLGKDFVAHTGKFHLSWGEFGGFKHPDALDYECAQMVALGSKCLVGDQLHPSGAINPDTYASLARAYARVARLEPVLEGARQLSDIAILSAEHFHAAGARNHAADDGAAQMLLELHESFDVVDTSADLSPYAIVILPDDIPLTDPAHAAWLAAYLEGGGAVIQTGTAGLGADGQHALPSGLIHRGTSAFNPAYAVADPALDPGLTRGPFVVYGAPQVMEPAGAEVLAQAMPSYFNRTWDHFCSHAHAPDDPSAAPIGAAAALHGRVATVAWPIFGIYHGFGQPLYRNLIRGLIARLRPAARLMTDLPTAGRATVTRQAAQGRTVVHLLYGPPQVRGKAVSTHGSPPRVLEMIEDIPAIGPVTAQLRLDRPPARVWDAFTGAVLTATEKAPGLYAVTLPRLHIHAAIVFEEAS